MRARGVSRPMSLAAACGLLATAGLFVLPASLAGASGATLSVAVGGTDAGNCQVAACATIGYALSQGSAGDTIDVGPGTFTEATLVMSYPVVIDGAGAGATTVDVSQHNPICATYIAVAISITTTNNPCTYPGPSAGTYVFNGLTLEGNPGGIASPSVLPFLMFDQNLPANTSIEFTNDNLVTNTSVDPALGTDESIGIYDLGSGPTDSITVSKDTISGFFQATFMEGFPGSLTATDSTYEDLTPIGPAGGGPYAPEGVYLLADAGGPMTGSYDISGNTFENLAGYGVRAKSGFFNPDQTGTLANVSVIGNHFDVQPLPGSLDGSAAVGIVGADNGGNTIDGVTVRSNSITASGSGAIDTQVSGDLPGNTFSNISITGNDLLGGPSTVGLDNEVPIALDAPGNFWGDPGGPGAPHTTTVMTGNGGTLTTAAPAAQPVFSPSDVTALDTSPPGPTTQGLVSWTPPLSAPDVPVSSYSVVPEDLNTSTSGPPVNVPGTQTSVTVTGLSLGDRFDFLVTANNGLVVTAPGISNVIGGPNGKGYWLDASDGGIFTFGSAQFYGSTGSIALNQPMVGMAATPDGKGYWLVAADGGVFAFGDAQFYGSMGSQHINQAVVGIASTASGHGYWLVAKDGGVFAFGDATFYGSTGGMHLNAAIVGLAATPDGGGYWIVGTDGGIFSYGDATFYGSTGSLALNQSVIGIAASPTGHGYWIAATDGGVFAFGDATFFGSMGGQPLNRPIVGIATNPSGTGYWLDASDGGVFAFGGAQFYGSMGATPLNEPVVGMTAH